MASQAPGNQLPLLYKQLQPLSSTQHGNFKARSAPDAALIADLHAVPLIVDEFTVAQRFYPIVFASGENGIPLALMGLNEGVNTFVEKDNQLRKDIYVPAYLRRYPFILARLRPDSEEMSLCFDPSSGLVGEYDEGAALFEDGKPTEAVNAILKFCEEFEVSAQRTQAFMNELKELDLLIDGEMSIQPTGSDQPFVYRGFRMVSEEKLRDLRGDALRKISQNGILPLVIAHLFSLQIVRELFGRQIEQGKGPQVPQPTTVPFVEAQA